MDKILFSIDNLSYVIGNKFEQLNIERLKTMGNHIKEIGEKGQNDTALVSLPEEESKANDNIHEMDLYMLAFCVGLFDDIEENYTKYAKDVYEEQEQAARDMGLPQSLPYEDNTTVKNIVRNVTQDTSNAFVNISRTTVTSEEYRQAIDEAVRAVQNGGDYMKITDSVVKRLSDKGNRVKYASGITRRLDSAARMNIYEGARRLREEINREQARRLGMDSVVVSAHIDCAPDHLEIQGMKYLISEFEQINNSLQRPIGTMNCRHYLMYTFSFLDNPYSDEYLADLRAQGKKSIDFHGKKITPYKATQMMRDLETRMRYTLDRIDMGKFSGNDETVTSSEQLLKTQQLAYKNLCKMTNMQPDWKRVYVGREKT